MDSRPVSCQIPAMRIMSVGGSVRDLLLGRASMDKDYLVLDADREEFLAAFPHAREAGRDFRVFLADGREYALPRGGSLMDDLLARDLTINAMARDEDGTIHAHPMALRDLDDRILRPCSPTAFADDPLRVFRAARFLAVFPDFSASPDLFPRMRSVARAGLLEGIPGERVGRETLKALAAPVPSRFLAALDQGGCLEPWFRELAEASSIPAGQAPHHDSSLLGHTAEVMDRLADKDAESLAVWAGLCHDLGKALTPGELLPRHFGHDTAGEEPARSLARRLKLSNAYADAGCLAASLHMKAGRYPELRPGTRVDLLTRLHARNLVRILFLLAEADGHGNHLPDAEADLEAILSVSLPERDRNLGEASGRKLRMLRAERLARGA